METETFTTDINVNPLNLGNITDATGANGNQPQTQPSQTQPTFSIADIEKARAEEKAKLYPRLETLETTLKELQQEKQARLDAEKAAEAERQALIEKEATEKLTLKEQLKKTQEEFENKLKIEREEREKLLQTLTLEQEYQKFLAHKNQRIEQERDNIAPELIDLVSGSTVEELEQSISLLRAKTEALMTNFQQATQQQIQKNPGTRVTSPGSGLLDINSGNPTDQTLDVRSMSMQDYIKNRSKILGAGANGPTGGLFS